MGVYIRDMEKPKNCTECPFKRDGECLAMVEEDNFDSYHQLYLHCPLIEIGQEAIDIAQDIIDGCKEFIGKFKVERKESQ